MTEESKTNKKIETQPRLEAINLAGVDSSLPYHDRDGQGEY